MKPVFQIIACAVSCLGIACTRSTASDAESATSFVQAFYDWYVPVLLKGGNTPPDLVALDAHPTWFDTSLARALRDDNREQAKVTGEVVGLDFDPYTGSQDPCEKYATGVSRAKGERILVEVYAACKQKRDSVPSVTAEVGRSAGAWTFINFYYPRVGESDLVNELKQLAVDRGKRVVEGEARTGHAPPATR